MRVKSFYRLLRSITYFVLFFFSWSYLELFEIPTALAAEGKQSGVGSKESGGNAGKPDSRKLNADNSERFEKALEAIRENISKAGDKAAKGEDDTQERAVIRAKKSEIEAADVEFKKEFSSTETKLKDAKLPKEILDRHYNFVKHYEDNLKELRANLDGIETAKTKTDRKAKIEKARLHLEKTKAPRHHTPLNPDQLPNRNRKATKTVEPRLKKEDFDRDFPQQKTRNKQKIIASHLLPDLLATMPKQKPILLAFNDIASDVPFQLPRPIRGEGWGEGGNPQIAFSDPSPLLLAQATDQPIADDLAETPDIQFTDAIRAKAQELGGNPVRIYEWVRSNIEYAPTYGSIQGADMCLQSKICNDIDTASLLISLLRVSGIYAHYVYGTVDIPIEKAMNWVGGVTDPKMVGTILATNGVPVTLLKTSGSVYKYARMEHVWVSAFIDMIPSRGAVHKQGDAWIPLDASYKQYTYTQGIDVASAVPFDALSFQLTTSINPDGSITNVNSALVQQKIQDYQTQVQNYIQQNYNNAIVSDVIGKKELIQQNYPILLGTLPYKSVQVGSEFATVPDNLRETISFSIPDPTGTSAGLSYTTSMPQIAGKKITLSFSPATANDQTVIESFLPTPHADGTPIQPSELPSSFHAYLINLKPELRIDGQVVATGAPITMGSAQSFTMSLHEPGFGLSNIDNIVKAGEYIGIGLDTGNIGADRIIAIKSKLQMAKTNLETQNFSAVTKDDLLGNLLYATIATYFAALDVSDDILAKATNVIRYRAPSVGMFSVTLNVQDVFGVAVSASANGMMMDVDRIMQSVFSKDGSMDAVKQYMLTSGGVSSALEHLIPEQLYSTANNPVQGISSVKALQIAHDQGVPLYVVNQANINSVLPQLQVNEAVKSDIANAVNAGKEVTVSKINISYNGWFGCGYIIIDPETGAGAYMISGGHNGAFERFMLDTILAILYLTEFAGIVAAACLPLAVAELGAIIYALESYVTAIAVNCYLGALGSPYKNDLVKQIADLPKRVNNVGSLFYQIGKIIVITYKVCFG